MRLEPRFVAGMGQPGHVEVWLYGVAGAICVGQGASREAAAGNAFDRLRGLSEEVDALRARGVHLDAEKEGE